MPRISLPVNQFRVDQLHRESAKKSFDLLTKVYEGEFDAELGAKPQRQARTARPRKVAQARKPSTKAAGGVKKAAKKAAVKKAPAKKAAAKKAPAKKAPAKKAPAKKAPAKKAAAKKKAPARRRL